MSTQWFFFTPNGGLTAVDVAPAGSRPFLESTYDLAARDRMPLHHSFAAWGKAQRSPGLVTPQRIWLGADGRVLFRFEGNDRPKLQSAVGAHAGLAAWIVLMDKFVDSSVLMTEITQLWSVDDLAGALAFITPAFLPRPLNTVTPENWERVARRLSIYVANHANRSTTETVIVS